MFSLPIPFVFLAVGTSKRKCEVQSSDLTHAVSSPSRCLAVPRQALAWLSPSLGL